MQEGAKNFFDRSGKNIKVIGGSYIASVVLLHLAWSTLIIAPSW